MNPFQPSKRLGFVWIEDFPALMREKMQPSSTMSTAELRQAWIVLNPENTELSELHVIKHSSNVAFGHIQRKEMKKRGCQMSAFCYGSQAVCITNKEITKAIQKT